MSPRCVSPLWEAQVHAGVFDKEHKARRVMKAN